MKHNKESQTLGFFDFLADMDLYADKADTVPRMNARHSFLIEPFKEEIEGARVFDIASHDGRWAYAFAGAGAREVVGVEARQELIDLFDDYPNPELRARVELRCNDLFTELESEVAKGETYDVVGVFGIFYHIMDHFRLLTLVQALKPKVIIVDSEFMDKNWPMIQMQRENTGNILNAASQIEGQKTAIVGYPSFKALDAMAEALGYDCVWLDWFSVPEEDRKGTWDYYRKSAKRRGTCALIPIS